MRILRFGVIVLAMVTMGLPPLLLLIYRDKHLGIQAWSPKFTATLLSILALFGSGVAGYDYMAFDAVPQTTSIQTVGIMLAGDADFGVYWDSTATNPVTGIEWGELEPGLTGSSTFYIKNEGASNLYAEAVWTIASWIPSGASQYFDLTWDFDTKMLRPGFAQRTVLELHVHDDITGIEDFSFEIIITSDDQPFP
ncbi:hypothetical protein LCGC14_2627110 [marine sediment metagenome]|uniref:Uncharacterized protein n=1 Tax=marine sediment metagenome TaxID=412755 RepID=A0A0F9ANZ7_9ZZZZ